MALLFQSLCWHLLLAAVPALYSGSVAGECDASSGDSCAAAAVKNVYLDEDNYYGREWANVTASFIERAGKDADIRIESSEPLILAWDNFATGDFVEKALDYFKRHSAKSTAYKNTPWCLPVAQANIFDELRRKGMTEQPQKSGENLCVSSPKSVKLLRETHGKGAAYMPSVFLGRAVVDEEMDELETFVRTKLGVDNLLEYGEDSNILEYSGDKEYTQHTDCSDAKQNDRVFTLLVYLTSPSEGGETSFYHPDVQMKVAPKRGAAVLFRNIGAGTVRKCDPRTGHQALPVGPGSDAKLVFQMWFDMRPISKSHLPNFVNCDGSGSCRMYTTRQGVQDVQVPLYTEYRPNLFRTKPGELGSQIPRPYSALDPYADHMGNAVQLAGMPDKFKEALAAFKAARDYSSGATDWGNLGFFHMQTAQKQQPGKRQAKLARHALGYFKKARARLASGKYDMSLGDPVQYGEFIRNQISAAEAMMPK